MWTLQDSDDVSGGNYRLKLVHDNNKTRPEFGRNIVHLIVVVVVVVVVDKEVEHEPGEQYGQVRMFEVVDVIVDAIAQRKMRSKKLRMHDAVKVQDQPSRVGHKMRYIAR